LKQKNIIIIIIIIIIEVKSITDDCALCRGG